MNQEQGRLFVISGPSGVGKGTIINKILPQFSNMVLSVSATTRAPREREKDGIHYFFITKEQFYILIAAIKHHTKPYTGTNKQIAFYYQMIIR